MMLAYNENHYDQYAPNRQPNFLQKLYDFLALEPHPCPDVIYWAADSKQLVIAQPDRLVKEVLPRLFKHDKLSSFGRQLNIYGFARVFPGRQFKDAHGRVLDASVWAHPTLHRLSNPNEIAGIKRRAAPKLFRTRRLANGQVVRSRAGPDVERRFREVKEGMAEERRVRNGWGGIGVGTGAGSVVEDHSAPGMGIGDGREFGRNLSVGGQHESGSEIRWQEIELDAEGWALETGRRGSNLSLDIGSASRTEGYAQQTSPVQATPHTARYEVRNHLTDIVEGVESHDITPAYFGSMNWDVLSPPALQLIGQGQPDPGHSQAITGVGHPLTPTTAREYQSCPASIHSSPVPHAAVPQTTTGDGNDSLTSWFGAPRTAPTLIPQLGSWDRYTSAHAPRIAAPAAASPFDKVHAQVSPPSLTWLQAPLTVPPNEDVFGPKWTSDDQFTQDFTDPQHHQDSMAIYPYSGAAVHPERASSKLLDMVNPFSDAGKGSISSGGLSMVAPKMDTAEGYEAEAGPRGGDALAPPPRQAEEFTGGTSASAQGAVMTVQELLRRQSDLGPGSVGQLKPSFAFDSGQVGNETPPFIPIVTPNMGLGLVGGGAAYTDRNWF
ncbi:hypothetical protein EHS25_005432 [Saitozyma podzolica]|uniref:HSF-type DNA-binding domain-containing protein n=1 Tax=Saitozyma podzolica TaxID=1890683 RepID=A0A427XYE5_9TREE|nr:hypothetical protein EHS25_005432 [Saitozyma podzolica]